MGGWILWVVLAGALVVAEVVTKRRRLATLALASATAAVGAAVAGTAAALAAFAIAAAVLLSQRRRSAARRVRRMRERARRDQLAMLREGPAALVGRDAVVLERIVNRYGVGIVDVDGQVFNARALDEDDEIDEGELVEVVDVRGATALVA